MDVQQIAKEIVAGIKEGDAAVRANLDKFYADDAVSIEPMDMSGMGRETHGLAAIHGKHDWWEGSMEEHEIKITGPFFHGDDQFSFLLDADVTETETGKRMQFSEIAVYHVKGGKIVREEFHYAVE